MSACVAVRVYFSFRIKLLSPAISLASGQPAVTTVPGLPLGSGTSPLVVLGTTTASAAGTLEVVLQYQGHCHSHTKLLTGLRRPIPSVLTIRAIVSTSGRMMKNTLH